MDFIIDNWQVILPYVLLGISELIAMFPKLKSNSIIQAILELAKKVLPKLIPFLIKEYKKK